MSGWSYIKSGAFQDDTVGPISDAEFLRLAENGEIAPATKVFHSSYTKNQWVEARIIPAFVKKYEAGEQARREAEAAARAEKERHRAENRQFKEELKRQRQMSREAELQAKAQERAAEAALAERQTSAANTRMQQQSVAAPAPAQIQPGAVAIPSRQGPVPEETLLVAHPSMFRNDPILFLVVVALCFVCIGIPILVLWWLKCMGTTLEVTSHRTTLRYGILSKHTTEVWHRDVRNVQMSQTFSQRAMGVGTIGIASAAHAGMEIQVSGMPNPEHVKALIDHHRG